MNQKKLLVSSALALAIVSLAVLGALWLLPGSGPAGERTARTPGSSAESRGTSPGETTTDPVPTSPGAQGTSAVEADPASATGASRGAVLHGRVTTISSAGDELPVVGADLHLFLASPEAADSWSASSLVTSRLLALSATKGGARATRHTALAQASTGENGEYSIPLSKHWAPSELALLARHPVHGATLTRVSFRGDSVELDVQLVPGEVIQGEVVDAEGAPVEGAVVIARPLLADDAPGRRLGAEPVADRATTDSAGVFGLHVAPGDYHLHVHARGFSRQVVEPVASGTTDLTIALEPSRAIEGHVVDEAGAPLSGVAVRLYHTSGLRGAALGADGGPRTFLAGAGLLAGREEAPGRLLQLLRDPEETTTTDQAGAFLFTDLARERFVIRASAPGRVASEGTASLEEEGTAALELVLTPGHSIRGVVLGPDRQPVAGALVLAAETRGGGAAAVSATARPRGRSGPAPSRPAAGGPGEKATQEDLAQRANPITLWRALDAARTSSDGVFELSSFAAGTYSLSVQKDGFLPHREDGLSLGEPIDLEIALEKGLALEGVVRAKGTQQPLAGARVRLAPDDDDRREVSTDEKGHYRVEGLLAGKIPEVEVAREGYVTLQAADLAVDGSVQVTQRDFELELAARLEGLVLDRQGNPIAGARVAVGDPPGSASGTTSTTAQGGPVPSPPGRPGPPARRLATSTDTSGRFALEGLPANKNLAAIVLHPQFKRLVSDEFQLAPGELRENLRLILSPGGSVRFTVLSSSGAPVPGTRVTLAPGADPVGAQSQGASRAELVRSEMRRQRQGVTRTAGDDGRVSFAGLTAQAYQVSTSRSGFQPLVREIAIVEDQELREALYLLDENVLQGTVTDARGAPVAGARVVARWVPGPNGEASSPQGFWPGTSSSTALSNPQGSFRVGSLPSGTFTLLVRAEGFAPKTLTEVSANSQVPAVLERLGGISGRVVSQETGLGIEPFDIQVLAAGEPGGGRAGRPRGPVEERSFADPTGAFALDGLAPGAYTLRILSRGQGGTEIPVRVDDGRVTEGLLVALSEGLSLVGTVVLARTGEPVEGAAIHLLRKKEESPGNAEAVAAADRASREERQASQARRRAERAGRRDRAPRLSPIAALAQQALAAALRGVEREGSPAATTDAAGGFQLRDTPPGAYTIVVTHPQLVPGGVELEVGVDSVTRFVPVLLERGETLTGSVLLGTGGVAPGALVMLRHSSGIRKNVRADADGRYMAEGLLQGAYTVSARLGGGDASFRGPGANVVVTSGVNRYDYVLAR